jgi:ribosomal protein S18 acetylase RimI-like enzyme
MIGVSAGYRKSWLPDPDGRSFGRVLLGESLRQIRDDWSPNPVPAVWASVAPPNKKSVEMFGAHGFTRYFPVPGWGEAVMWRPPKLGVV